MQGTLFVYLATRNIATSFARTALLSTDFLGRHLMKFHQKTALFLLAGTALLTTADFRPANALPQSAPSQTTASRQLGTVKSVGGNTITLTTDSGSELTATVAEGARIVRTAPGQKDLAGATPIQLSEIQSGDRVLIRTKPSEDGKSTLASAVIVMKKTDIADKQAREREDWQRRSVGGPVTAIDTASGTITISASAPGGSKPVAVHTTPATVFRRYAPDSIKFDDAKIAKLNDIKVGDQIRARGNRNEDGSEVTAEEIVAGTFRNIAATVTSTDAANKTLTVMDLATKKPVVVRVTPDSQLRKLPPMMAQGIAMRLKGGSQGPQTQGASQNQANGGSGTPASAANGAAHAGPGTRGDFNQMLGRLPVQEIGELNKGDAVMIVSTQGTGAEVTAITLLSGVEPILTASPNGNGSMILSPWNLSSGGEGGEGPAQ